MSLIRYQPWSLFDQLRRELESGMRHLPEDSFANSDWTPAVDIKETDTGFELTADIPGVKPEDIDVHLEAGVLTIEGEKHSEHTEEKDDIKRIERSYGRFYRRFSLPESADAEQVTANSDHGVLKVTIGKKTTTPSEPRKIEVAH